MVYTAQSQSLAALEMLVHLDSSELLGKYVLLAAEFDQSLIRPVELSALPRNWRADPPPSQVRSIGDDWTLSGSSAALQVPSALVPGESNFLLNPGHRDFAKVRIGKPLVFCFDPRMGK
jgi:RES domain-containing protein